MWCSDILTIRGGSLVEAPSVLEVLAKPLSEGKVRARVSRRGRSKGSSFAHFPKQKTMVSPLRRSGKISNSSRKYRKTVFCRAASLEGGPRGSWAAPGQYFFAIFSALAKFGEHMHPSSPIDSSNSGGGVHLSGAAEADPLL